MLPFKGALGLEYLSLDNNCEILLYFAIERLICSVYSTTSAAF